MPRSSRSCPGGLVYHVWNRAAGRPRLFMNAGDTKKSYVPFSPSRNLSPALIQQSIDSCGLYAASSALERLGAVPEEAMSLGLYGENVYAQMARNTANGGFGLATMQVRDFLAANLGENGTALWEESVSMPRLEELLGRGSVVAHVDGNHFVNVLESFEDGGETWLKIYDPARGTYDQLATSFMTRTGANNQMITAIRYRL